MARLKEKALEVYNYCKRKQRTARGGIWKNWEVKMLRDDEGVPKNVGPECNECKEVHTYSNPSQTNATHWRNGKCQTREKRTVALIAGEADGAALKKAKLVQSSFDDFTAKPAVAEFARSQIALKKHAVAYETELSTKRPADRVHIGVQAVFKKRIN
jgi:hypothetical protein